MNDRSLVYFHAPRMLLKDVFWAKHSNSVTGLLVVEEIWRGSPIRTHPLFGNLRFLFSRLGRPKFGVENMSCLNLGESKPAKCPSHEILVGFFQVKTWWLSLDDHDPNWKIFKKTRKKTTQHGPFLSLLSLQITPRKGAHLPMVSYIPWSCRVWEGCYDAAKWSLYTSH